MSIDLAELFTENFVKETDKRLERSEYGPADWGRGGRASKAWPNKEDDTWWLTQGPHMLEQWATWWEGFKAEGGKLWRTPTGLPAIELQVNAVLSGQPFKCYIDAIVEDPDGDVVVVDWKTGREPVAPIQLGAYAVAVEKTLHVRPKYGTFYLARKGELGNMYDLSIYDESLVGSWLKKAADIEKRGDFIPHPSSLCSACSVRDHCLVMGGINAHNVPPF